MWLIFNEKVAEKWDLWVPWLKSCWKIAKKVIVCALFTPQSQQSQFEKKKVKNTDVNARKRLRFPNAHLDKTLNSKDMFGTCV